MRNTTKLKTILQLYTVQLDMDEDEQYILTLRHKRTGASETFVHKSHSAVLAKGFGYMKRGLKFRGE